MEAPGGGSRGERPGDLCRAGGTLRWEDIGVGDGNRVGEGEILGTRAGTSGKTYDTCTKR